MSTADALAELDKGLTRFDDIAKRIVRQQTQDKVDQGRKLLTALKRNVVEAKRELTGEEPAVPDEPDEPGPVIPGPHPPTVPPPPDPGKVTSGKTFSGGKRTDGEFLRLAGLKNHVFTKLKFLNSERHIIRGDAGRGVLFSESAIDGLRGDAQHHCIFPGENWQTSDDVYELMCVGLEFGKNNVMEDEVEIKGSNVYVIGCQGPFSVRIRHGVGTIVMNNPECWNTSVRCGPHWVGGMPKCKVRLHAGNLDGRQGHWEPDSGAPDVHKPGGGHNMESAVEANVWAVDSIELGYSFGANDKKYPAMGCIIDPALKSKTKVINEKGTLWQPVKPPQIKAVRALENIKRRMTRDVAEAPAAERNREHEVYEWFLEANANALKQAGAA